MMPAWRPVLIASPRVLYLHHQGGMKDTVRILLLGDPGAGKSSLISTFVSQCFPEKVSRYGRKGGKEDAGKPRVE